MGHLFDDYGIMGYIASTKPLHYITIWLVVLTSWKNISQWEALSHILWQIKMFETTNR